MDNKKIANELMKLANSIKASELKSKYYSHFNLEDGGKLNAEVHIYMDRDMNVGFDIDEWDEMSELPGFSEKYNDVLSHSHDRTKNKINGILQQCIDDIENELGKHIDMCEKLFKVVKYKTKE